MKGEELLTDYDIYDTVWGKVGLGSEVYVDDDDDEANDDSKEEEEDADEREIDDTYMLEFDWACIIIAERHMLQKGANQIK